MDQIRADVPEHVDQLWNRYHEDFDLIDSGVCFVLADGTERIVFANRKIASLYECENSETFLKFCSYRYVNMVEDEDYKPLAELANGHPEHIPLTFHYRTKNGHFRKADGTGTLKDTPFGKAYVLLLFSAEQLASDMRVQDNMGVLGMHDFFQAAFEEAEKRKGFSAVRKFCPTSFDLTSFKEYNRLYGMKCGDLCLKKIAETIT